MAPQKRSADETYCSLKDVDMFLMDVEGATIPIKFLTDTLFPYVKDNVESYIIKHFDEDECQSIVAALRALSDEDKKNEVAGLVEIPMTDDKDALIKAIVDNITWQMSQDRSTTVLKQLQGHVLREGFKQGNLKAPLYDDVAPVLKKLCAKGKRICIFSSGSVETQKLVFGHTKDGDLQEHITDYYDTTMGSKKDVESYKKIAEESGVSTNKIVFLTHKLQEASAATSAGMKVHLVLRPNDGPHSDANKKDYSCIESFCELIEGDEGTKKLAGENEVGAAGDANGTTPADGDDAEDQNDDDADDDDDDDEGADDEGA